MNPRIKKLWLKALRSGKYQQAEDRLRVGDTYCCLGVLCDILKDEVDGKWQVDSNGSNSFQIGERFSTYGVDPPVEVVRIAELKDGNPQIKETAISRYNDGEDGTPKHNFNEIADLIEKYL